MNRGIEKITNLISRGVTTTLNALLCSETAIFRRKFFWIALPFLYVVATWIWPFGWMRWKEQTRIAQADIPGFECNQKHRKNYRSGWVGFSKGESPFGIGTYPVTGTDDTILHDPTCIASMLNGMLYYEGKWVLDVVDPKTGETIFTITKHDTPRGRPAHEGSVSKP